MIRTPPRSTRTSTLFPYTSPLLSRYFPKGVEYKIPYDTSPFVKVSITKVIYTLGEAMLLVFAVMFLFLQNIRYTLIPTLVVPVALMGTFATMLALGRSEEHTSELQSLMRISYAVFCLKKKTTHTKQMTTTSIIYITSNIHQH